MPDPLFFVPLPHSDIHVVMGTPLKMDVQMAYLNVPTDKHYTLGTMVNNTIGSQHFSIDVSFLAYHEAPGNRFANVPKVDPNTGDITATTPGVYLFQVKILQKIGTTGDPVPIGSVVGRLQVHQGITDWWFGNKSITTAKHAVAHAQPSIYARFTPNDPAGTDVVGDITGHGYVTLDIDDKTKAVADARGRLRGLAVTTTNPVKLTGTFLNKSHTVDVRVLDYAATRNELAMVRLASTDDFPSRSNLVFVAEGFADTPADRALFSGAVAKVEKLMFGKPRQDPFGMLKNRFNVFALFAPSQERGLTLGFQVTDNPTVFGTKGIPIPFTRLFEAIPGGLTLEALVKLVGLPKHGDARPPAQVKALWDQQRPGLNLGGVENKLVEAWQAHRADGFLDAVDTRFGMRLGRRLADGDPEETFQTQAVDRPATDNPADAAMKAYIARLYRFFAPREQREVTLDSRRHPPELYGFDGLTNAENSISAYLAGQTFTHPFDLPGQSTPVGKEWVPDDSKVTPSRGLVVIVAYEPILGGVGLSNSTMVGTTASEAQVRIDLLPPDTGQPERFARRPQNPPAPPPPTRPPNFRQNMGIVDVDYLTNVVSHELGHMFSLGDEYEVVVAQDPFEATSLTDTRFDNITGIGTVRKPDPDPTKRLIDPTKAKWLELPRMQLSSRLAASAKPAGGRITVQVNPNDIPDWTRVFQQGLAVSLRRLTDDARRDQLPLHGTDVRFFQNNLKIQSTPDRNTGAIVLNFPTALPPTVPEFPPGSALYVPQTRAQKTVLVVDDPVQSFMQTNQRTLNHRPNPKVGVNDLDPPDLLPNLPTPSRNTYRTVGIYEGGNHASRGYFRPTGGCKMRDNQAAGEGGAYCFVCRWLLVNVVDPGRHTLLDTWYPGGRHG